MKVLLSNGKWTKILSCYKDELLSNVYTQTDQTIEFEVFNGTENSKPLINSCVFQLTVVQWNSSYKTVGLQRHNINSDYYACYNIVKDDKGRDIVQVFIKNTTINIKSAWINVKKCPNINLFTFYSNDVPVVSITGAVNALDFNQQPLIETTSLDFTHTEGENKYYVSIKKCAKNIFCRITIAYTSGSINTIIPNTNIPLSYRPSEQIYTQRIKSYDSGSSTLIMTSVTFNTDGTILINSNNNTGHLVYSQFITTN